MRLTVRFVSLVTGAVVVSGVLAGYSVAESCESPYAEGSAALVTASGNVGTKPVVDFPMPLVSRDTAVAVLMEGDGALISEGDYVDFDAVVVRGDDKVELTSTSYTEGQTERTLVVADDVLSNVFICQRAGSRIALTGTLESIFGDVSGSGLTPTDTIAVVFDIAAAYPGTSNGLPQLAQDGMPAVTSDPTGRPGIAIPNVEAPTELRISTLTKGDGQVVAEGDTVVAHYSGFLWSGTMFDSSWDRNRPADLVAQDFTTNDGVGVVPGFAKALIGQSVGSRVLVVIPPSEGYPAGQEPSAIPVGATMIFVIDILGVK